MFTTLLFLALGQALEYRTDDRSDGLSPTDLYNFVTGIFNGLEKNPSDPGNCYLDFSVNAGYVMAAVNDFGRFMDGDTLALEQMLTDIEDFWIGIQNSEVNKDCNFSDLVYKLEHINKNDVLLRCTLHHKECTEDLKYIRECNTDYGRCGQSVGALIRILVNWNLN